LLPSPNETLLDARPDAADLEAIETPEESWLERWRDPILGVVAVSVVLGAWQWVGTSGIINPLFTSAPSRVAAAFVRLTLDGTLLNDSLVSGQEFVIGYGMAIAIGVPMGVLIGWYRSINAIVGPFSTALYATPRIALMPLMIIWLGIGLWSKVAVVFLGAVFPLLINMQAAMKTLDADMVKASRCFGASQWDVFRTIALPASVPFLISGLRLALGHSLIGIVVGEMFAATAGIGYRITIAGSTFRTDEVFVGVVVMIIAGLGLNAVALYFERRFSVWRPGSN
jgi:NitT/TauT family transport system permease protein